MNEERPQLLQAWRIVALVGDTLVVGAFCSCCVEELEGALDAALVCPGCGANLRLDWPRDPTDPANWECCDEYAKRRQR